MLTDPVFCGLPVPGTDSMVVDFATGEPLPLGEPGEIVVRGRPSPPQRAHRRCPARVGGRGDGGVQGPWIELLDSFPMTATGKIKKAELRPASRTRPAP